MQHCKRFGVPICWDQETYLRGGAISKWEQQAHYGYRAGIAMAMHLPKGEHFFLGVDRATPISVRERVRLTGEVGLLALYAQASASRLLLPDLPHSSDMPRLTRREIEVLKWTFAGKTAWEVGQLLHISERTAAIHANRASHKLECHSKHQAALKATRLGLI